jgi:hypothetical protein
MPQVSRKVLVRMTTNSNWRAILVGNDPADNRVLPYAAGLESPSEVVKRVRERQGPHDAPVNCIHLCTGVVQNPSAYLIGERLETSDSRGPSRFLAACQRVRVSDVMARGTITAYGADSTFFLDMVGVDDVSRALAFQTVQSAMLFVSDLQRTRGMKLMRVYRLSSRAIDRSTSFIEIARNA